MAADRSESRARQLADELDRHLKSEVHRGQPRAGVVLYYDQWELIIATLRSEGSENAAIALLEKWTGDGHLQTFEDRERFRKEARMLLAERDSVFHPHCDVCNGPAPSSGGCQRTDCGIRQAKGERQDG